MTKLSDLMSIDDLETEMKAGFVRERRHPADPRCTILNYTEKAQYEKHWTDVTRQTRGLIVLNTTREVLARPFDKFFNYGEHEADSLDLEAAVRVTDKMDGSLGILYYGPQGWAVATRGSFESEQAIHATDVLRDRYLAEGFTPVEGVTYLFEIVYPTNRIVLDYHGADDLFFLAARDIASGQIYGPETANSFRWAGPQTQILPYTTLGRALEAPPRPNAEGLVVRYAWTDAMVKIKQEDYVRLHKLVTGLNERAVWEHLASHNGTYGDLLASVPDEFHDWVTTTAEGFLDDYESLQGWAHATYHGWMEREEEWGEGWTRKDFALWAREQIHPGMMFQMLDGRDISPAIWKTLKPKGETNSLLNRNEDVS
jgi:RNA ligase